jgi:hypothetical protein
LQHFVMPGFRARGIEAQFRYFTLQCHFVYTARASRRRSTSSSPSSSTRRTSPLLIHQPPQHFMSFAPPSSRPSSPVSGHTTLRCCPTNLYFCKLCENDAGNIDIRKPTKVWRGSGRTKAACGARGGVW